MKKNYALFILLAVSFIFFSGCTVTLEKGRRGDVQKIQNLEDELAELRGAKSALEDQLSAEIGSEDISVRMGKRGLVITFVDQVLFGSGRATLKPSSLPILNKVVKVLKVEAVNNKIGIEGHTDNVPIKHSGWKSNWELSSHRALSVLSYLQKQNIDPNRLSATGYGEYHPVASNGSKAGRKRNRRVEIVILPRSAGSKAMQSGSEEEGYRVIEEELK